MAHSPNKPIKLTRRTRAKLERVARATSEEFRLVVRARLVLMLADGESHARIARRLGVSERTVTEWRKRFAKRPRLSTLRDRERSGRPPTISVQARCEVLKLACERPESTGDEAQPTFRDVWTYESLRKAAAKRGAVMSRSEIYRTLHDRNLRPHRIQLWLHSQDPDFRAKANRICKLYLQPPKGAVLLSIDEKTGMQALERKHPMKLAVVGRHGRQEYEYKRNGTQTLIAAFDVRTGKVFGQCGPTRTADDLMAFMEEVARRYPHKRVYIIWDNLNIHHGERWREFNERHGNRFHFVHTPLHASWLNQVEIWFGILHKRVLRYGSFTSVGQLRDRVLGFVEYWNRFESHPFRWTFRGFRVKADLRLAA